MASAARSDVTEPVRSVAAEVPYRVVPWASCLPSPLNPRKYFDPEGLKELAGTMGSEVGLIEPLVVRPTKNKHQYEIVAGERRWRAAELAGVTELPVIVREGLTEVQVLRMMVIENKQRRDLNALEEAEGFYQLTKRGVDIDTIAADIKLSRKYVYDRLKLRDLVPLGQRLLAEGRITAGHAILIARLGSKQQMRILEADKDGAFYNSPLFELEDDGALSPEQERAEGEAAKRNPYVAVRARSVRELEGWIAEHCRFDLKAPLNREVHPETAAAVEKAAKVVQITRNHFTQPDAKQGNTGRIYHSASWKRADGALDYEGFGNPKASKRCDRAVLGVVVAGPGRGESFDVCVDKACDVHWKAERGAREKRTTGEAAAQQRWKQQQQRDQQRREAEEKKRTAERAAWKAARPTLLAALADKVKTTPQVVLLEFIAVRLRSEKRDRDSARQLLGASPDPLRALALAELVDASSNEYWAPWEFTPIAKRFGVDVAAILKASAKPAPAVPASSARKAARKRGGR
jgi:ParB/RepB/Spo0J family partition protein